MKLFAVLLTMLFALSVNMAPAVADSDDHHNYEKHEKKYGHDKRKHDDDHEQERDHRDAERKHGDRDKQEMSREHRNEKGTGMNNQRQPVHQRNMPDWWPF